MGSNRRPPRGYRGGQSFTLLNALGKTTLKIEVTRSRVHEELDIDRQSDPNSFGTVAINPKQNTEGKT
jgi:hypothetical protein